MPSHVGLWQLFHDPDFGFAAAPEPWRPVLIFDQFEELFTLGESQRAADTHAFLESLAGLVENRPPAEIRAALEEDDTLADRLVLAPQPCKVPLTLRDVFLHRLERWRRQTPSMMDNRLELRLLSGPQAYRAVYEPGAKRTTWDRLPACQEQGKLLQQVIDAAREAAIPVIIDFARTTDFSRYRGTNVLKPNRIEAEQMLASFTGIRASEIASIDNAMHAAQIACNELGAQKGVRNAPDTVSASRVVAPRASGRRCRVWVVPRVDGPFSVRVFVVDLWVSC